jgi:hypothetical protein
MLPSLGRLALAAPAIGPLPPSPEPTEVCVICMEDIGLFHPDMYVRACSEGHLFHLECMRTLMVTTPAAPCPECRRPILPTTIARLQGGPGQAGGAEWTAAAAEWTAAAANVHSHDDHWLRMARRRFERDLAAGVARLDFEAAARARVAEARFSAEEEERMAQREQARTAAAQRAAERREQARAAAARFSAEEEERMAQREQARLVSARHAVAAQKEADMELAASTPVP